MIGIGLIILECMSGIASISCLQLITDLPPMFELNTLRFAIGFVFVVVYLVFTWQLPSLDRGLIKWTLLGILATYIFNLTFYNEHVKELPITAVFGTKRAFAMFLGAAASKVVLKEKLGWLKITLIFATFVGIGFVISSSFLPINNEQGIRAEHLQISDKTLTNIQTADKSTRVENTKGTNFPNPYRISFSNVNITTPAFSSIRKADSQNDSFLNNYPVNLQNDSLLHEYTAEGIIISIALIFTAQLAAIVENLAISGTGLREVNGVFLAFWYFLSGTLLSLLTSIIIEDVFIPNNTMDKILSVIHCIAASAVTFTYIIAVKLTSPALLTIIFSIHIPLALTAQMFLLGSVTPPVELWVLILGLAIITLSVFVMSISAIFFSK